MKLTLALIASFVGIVLVVVAANRFSDQTIASDTSNEIPEISIGEPIHVTLGGGIETPQPVATTDLLLDLSGVVDSGGVEFKK